MRWLKGAVCGIALIAAVEPARAQCDGADLLPALWEKDPAAFAEIEARERALPFAKGKLFRIEREGLRPSYLFGTMHVADPRITSLSDATEKAFGEADPVAFELEHIGALNDSRSFEGMGVRALRYILPKVDERIERMLPEAEIRRLEAALAERGQPRTAARSFKPVIVALALLGQLCRRDKVEDVLDARLAVAAREDKKTVLGLETVEEQIASVTLIPAEEQRRLIVGTMRILDRMADIYETSARLYLKGDIGFLLAWMVHPRAVPGAEIEVPALFYRQLIEERNTRMRDRALPLLEEGGAFIAVGAAHLPGEKGLARLFQAAGYRVTRVMEADAP